MDNNEIVLETEIIKILRRLGIPPHLKGHKYLVKAIMMSVRDDGVLDGVTKFVYPSIAKEYSVTASSVERAIRVAVETSWNRGDIGYLHELFGFTLRGNNSKPTNRELIYTVVERIKYGKI